MLRRNLGRRVGFTLIELLVVISIIAILTSLLVAGVMRVRAVSKRADSSARIAGIGTGIGTFKSSQSFGQAKYIPAGRLENGVWLPFRLRNSYPDTAAAGEPNANSFEAAYLQQVFGGGSGLNLLDLGYRDASGQPNLKVDLDANQTLTFFLCGFPEFDAEGNAVFTGFSSHPNQPFTRRLSTDEARRGPVLAEMGGSRKYLIDPTNKFARLIDAYGNPFAYFAAYNGMANKYYGGYGNDKLVNEKGQAMGAVKPYNSGAQFEHPSGFQIISAGQDGLFGTTGNWKVVDEVGKDDQANFSSNPLGAGPQ